MLVWLLVLVAALLLTPVLFVLASLVKRIHRQERQGFARRPTPDPMAVDVPAPPTRKKPDWDGLTPIDIGQTPPQSAQMVQMLDGLLVGYHIRR